MASALTRAAELAAIRKEGDAVYAAADRADPDARVAEGEICVGEDTRT